MPFSLNRLQMQPGTVKKQILVTRLMNNSVAVSG